MSSVEREQTKPGRTRVLACALCKQRRIKCSRSFPCAACTRSGVSCVQPAARPRRRRFAERELLDRIRRYEDLLRENHLSFEPLHGDLSSGHPTPDHDGISKNKDKETVYVRDIWQVVNHAASDDGDEGSNSGHSSSSSSSSNSSRVSSSGRGSYDDVDKHVKEAVLASDHLLFGAPIPGLDLAVSHPPSVHLFRLWQVYLDNVHPLLKVTHTPTLQPRIIDAAADPARVSPALEALLFALYSVAVLSLTDEQCRASFRASRDGLLSGYQVACKQALLRCAPWRSNEHECLTALYLYLVSISSQVDPRSLSCMVAVAVRVAQRMGMPYESSYKSPPCSTALEAEMRRRLWWALVLLDHRLCEIVGQERSSALTPTWDCRPPLNVSDFELQADAKRGPSTHEKSPTEALFVVVRSELADYVRHSPSHAKGTSGEDSSPSSSSSSSSVVPNESDRPPRSLDVLETHMDATHLSQCNPEIPLHYMTVWAARGFFARRRLTEHYLAHAASDPPKRWTDAQRSTAYESALLMLECDTALRRSPLVAGFLWLVDAWSSPVFAYVHLLNGLTRRPGEGIADRAWRTMSDHYEAVAKGPPHHRTRLMFDSKFPRFILRAWEAREAWHTQKNNALPMLPPRLVLEARERAVQTSSAAAAAVRSNSPDERWLGLEPSRAAHADSSTAVRCLFSTSGGVGGQQAQASGGEVQGFGMAMPADLLQGGPSQGTTDMPDLVVDQFWSDNVFEWM